MSKNVGVKARMGKQIASAVSLSPREPQVNDIMPTYVVCVVIPGDPLSG
jgi:hypothetical protein